MLVEIGGDSHSAHPIDAIPLLFSAQLSCPFARGDEKETVDELGEAGCLVAAASQSVGGRRTVMLE